MFIPETHGLRIASKTRFLWNQCIPRKLLITLAEESAGHFRFSDFRVQISD